MGIALLSESHGSSLEINKIINVDQGPPIINRQSLSFETGWGPGVTASCPIIPSLMLVLRLGGISL